MSEVQIVEISKVQLGDLFQREIVKHCQGQGDKVNRFSIDGHTYRMVVYFGEEFNFSLIYQGTRQPVAIFVYSKKEKTSIRYFDQDNHRAMELKDSYFATIKEEE